MSRTTVTRITAFWSSVFGATLLGLAGCDQPPTPGPVVLTDTQSDLRHDHKHLHGDPHRHEHQHDENFSGTHTHPHAHGHRHAPAPHGGIIVSLRWTAAPAPESPAPESPAPESPAPESPAWRRPIPSGPHLEIVQRFPVRLKFYFLSESEHGQWERWDVGPSAPAVRVDAGDLELNLKLVQNPDGDGYQASLTPPIQSLLKDGSTEIRLSEWMISADGRSFDVPAEVVYRNGELDVVVD